MPTDYTVEVIIWENVRTKSEIIWRSDSRVIIGEPTTLEEATRLRDSLINKSQLDQLIIFESQPDEPVDSNINSELGV